MEVLLIGPCCVEVVSSVVVGMFVVIVGNVVSMLGRGGIVVEGVIRLFCTLGSIHCNPWKQSNADPHQSLNAFSISVIMVFKWMKDHYF